MERELEGSGGSWMALVEEQWCCCVCVEAYGAPIGMEIGEEVLRRRSDGWMDRSMDGSAGRKACAVLWALELCRAKSCRCTIGA